MNAPRLLHVRCVTLLLYLSRGEHTKVVEGMKFAAPRYVPYNSRLP
jgi:hypothetical protein